MSAYRGLTAWVTAVTVPFLFACSGSAGAKGDAGAAGVKGDKGDKGDPGEAGPKGDKGDPGAVGATGATGATGAQGAKGDPGTDGSAGVAMADVKALFMSPANGANKSDLDLWKIQFGLGSVMIEYATRMNNLYFAAQASNWNMVLYQIEEMKEIQETGEITRPSKAQALKDFESSYLDAMTTAATAKDAAAFNTAYANAIGGCNDCHKAMKTTAFPSGNYSFVKIKIPTASNFNNVDWAGQ